MKAKFVRRRICVFGEGATARFHQEPLGAKVVWEMGPEDGFWIEIVSVGQIDMAACFYE